MITKRSSRAALVLAAALLGAPSAAGQSFLAPRDYRGTNYLPATARGPDGITSFLLIDNPLSRSDWHGAVREIIERNGLEDGYLRIQVSRGEGLSSIKWTPDDWLHSFISGTNWSADVTRCPTAP